MLVTKVSNVPKALLRWALQLQKQPLNSVQEETDATPSGAISFIRCQLGSLCQNGWSKVLAPSLGRNGPDRRHWSLLKFSRLHSNWNTDSKDASQRDGSIAAPQLGVTPPSSRRTPHTCGIARVMSISMPSSMSILVCMVGLASESPRNQCRTSFGDRGGHRKPCRLFPQGRTCRPPHCISPCSCYWCWCCRCCYWCCCGCCYWCRCYVIAFLPFSFC